MWTYAGVNTFKAGRLDELAMHPTVKPVALVADAMKDCSRRKRLVLDPFLGSGTTIMAGEKVGRRVRGIECDPAYVDVAVRRWQAFTRADAVLEATGEIFAEVQARRAAEGVGACGGATDGDAAHAEPPSAPGGATLDTAPITARDDASDSPLDEAQDNGWVRLCRP